MIASTALSTVPCAVSRMNVRSEQLILQWLEQFVPAHPRHDQIADDDRGPEAGDPAQRFFTIRRFVGLEAPVLHQLGQAGAGGRIVLHDEHPLARSVRK